MFALVDVNSFYTSCETVFRPDLQGNLLSSFQITMAVLFLAQLKQNHLV